KKKSTTHVRNTGGAIVAAAAIKISEKSYPRRRRRRRRRNQETVDSLINTPLIRINSLSEATGCQILAKAEFLNPGGSVKDRVAVKIIEEALDSGELGEW
ncbi:hypothetical protein MKW94_022284, partial [Papaver nudicaule]|nr:hypothetical protein [Papaver nudicaule]